MSGFSRQEFLKSIKDSIQERKKKLQNNMPEIERRLFDYAGKMGLHREDMEKTRDRIREKIHKARNKD
ncbi:hypothetical protein [Desulfonatronospira sp.]|uniref:hypothetical protein n=1 Tax=Desulfonatronospira sp. TaxID=1962951 RepID=UPI0025B91638|nr:hypothetical protein [Desulfonatronospira sp.]